MKTVLFIKSSDFASMRQRIAGFMSYASSKRWNVQIVEAVKSAKELNRLISFWTPDGCAVSCGTGNNAYTPSQFKSPVIYIDKPVNKLSREDSYVCHDSAATARMATRELLTLNLAHYAYVGTRLPMDWDGVRRRTFTEMLRAHKRVFSIFDAASCTDDGRVFVSRLSAWIKTLPKPLGVLAATDMIAAKVINACQHIAIAVPNDCAVIGIDNDSDICEYVTPTLTSVEPDYHSAGRTAAIALDGLMSGSHTLPIRKTYEPLRLVRRESSRRLQCPDSEVSSAIERIRKEGCNGLTAHDVITGFNCSRRMSELRFRKAVGHSILDEIRAVRLEHAKNLLLNSNAKLDAIANWCGYKSAAAFSIFYKAETGMTPRGNPHKSRALDTRGREIRSAKK